MPIDAFATRRVAQTLESIGDYLEEGARIARQIQPGRSLQLTLEPITRTPGPIVTRTVWVETGGDVLEHGPGTSTVQVRIQGEHLALVNAVALVAAPSPSEFFEAEAIVSATDTEVIARVTLTDPAAVTYHVKVTTSGAKTFLRREALAIERPEDPQESELAEFELGALVPGTLGRGARTARLILLRGAVADLESVHITTLDGTPVAEAQVEIQRQAVVRGGRPPRPGSNFVEEASLSMTLPPVPEDTLLCLVARTRDGAEDRIAFTVRP